MHKHELHCWRGHCWRGHCTPGRGACTSAWLGLLAPPKHLAKLQLHPASIGSSPPRRNPAGAVALAADALPLAACRMAVWGMHALPRLRRPRLRRHQRPQALWRLRQRALLQHRVLPRALAGAQGRVPAHAERAAAATAVNASP